MLLFHSDSYGSGKKEVVSCPAIGTVRRLSWYACLMMNIDVCTFPHFYTFVYSISLVLDH